MGRTGKGLSLAFFLLLFALCPAAAENADAAGAFPLIARLDSFDTGFKQYIGDVEFNRRRLFSQPQTDAAFFGERLTVYRYVPAAGENIFILAARCNIPYSALASLNRLENSVMLDAGSPILLPSCPGIFLPALPRSDFEKLLAARLSQADEGAAALSVKTADGASEAFYFFPGADFNATERIFFLNSGFRFPLRNFRLTSAYGVRQNPVTGNMRFHEGLDLAAPAGTDVFAAAEGTVTEIGTDSIYGNYVVIKHGENWASLYGHLQSVETTLRSVVQSASLIGRVGSTGQSTGPHLHFELRENGRAQDPGKYLFQRGQ